MQATDCEANASLSSTRSMSATVSPARSSSLRMAGTGPIPMTRGSTPATAVATTRAIGRSPIARARPASTTSRADAPSLIPDAFPAVTVPPSRNAGRSFARPSAVASGRGCSSRATRTGSPFRWGIGTGTSWASKRPSSMAAAVRRWLSRAKASWRSRDTCHSSATHSAVSPSEIAG